MNATHLSLELSRKVTQCIQRQKWHQAKHHCQRLLKLDSHDAQVHQLLGLIHVQLAAESASVDMREEHVNRAIQGFLGATQYDPSMFDAFLNLGNAYLQAQQADAALQAFHAALVLNPNSDLVHANQAEAYRQLGNHSQALASLSRAVELAPEKHGLLVKTGNLLRELGQHEQAIACYEQAIQIEPDQAQAYAHMAVSMEELGHHEAAMGCCKIALEIDPSESVALYHRALLEMRNDDEESALKSLNAFLEFQPHSSSALMSKGSLLVNQENYSLALSVLDHAIELGVSTADAFQQRALCHQELEQWDLAVDDLEKALAIDPHHSVALMSLGVISQKMGRFEAAIRFYTQSIEQDPTRVEAYSNLGAVLFESNRFEDARVTLEAAIELNPKLVNAWTNLGATLMQLYRFQESLAAFDQVLQLKPDHVDALSHKGLVMHDLHRIEEALSCYELALKIDPENTLARWNKAFGSLLNGDFKEGWIQYEARWAHKKNKLQLREYPQPRWTKGASLNGQHLFVYQEQGLGDTLMFARYIPVLTKMGAQVTFEVQPALVQLLTRCLPQARIIAMGQPAPEFDLHTPLLSIPALLETNESNIPFTAQFLSASPAKIAEWQHRLGPQLCPRIGLVWSGNAAHQNDRNRSLNLQSLLDVLPDGIDYICLQNEIRSNDTSLLEATQRVRSFTQAIRDFEDTAALCQCVDMVLSVDTSVAHLSAALGQITWTLIPYSPDWRWMQNRSDTPWYASMHLYRQTTPGDWRPTLTTVAQDLASRFVASAKHPSQMQACAIAA